MSRKFDKNDGELLVRASKLFIGASSANPMHDASDVHGFTIDRVALLPGELTTAATRFGGCISERR